MVSTNERQRCELRLKVWRSLALVQFTAMFPLPPLFTTMCSSQCCLSFLEHYDNNDLVIIGLVLRCGYVYLGCYCALRVSVVFGAREAGGFGICLHFDHYTM